MASVYSLRCISESEYRSIVNQGFIFDNVDSDLPVIERGVTSPINANGCESLVGAGIQCEPVSKQIKQEIISIDGNSTSSSSKSETEQDGGGTTCKKLRSDHLSVLEQKWINFSDKFPNAVWND